MDVDAETATAEPIFRPLYQQVRERLQRRLIEGTWPPGTLLPSEGQLAADLRVSQGTVRKALDAMAAENLLVRRQGRGTFVAVPDESSLQFQFFRIRTDSDERLEPQSEVVGFRKLRADAAVRAALGLGGQSWVWEVERVRRLCGEPRIVERIVLPVARFPGLDRLGEFPNNAYAMYSSAYGITICRAAEQLRPGLLDAGDGVRLGAPPGTPVLEIVRTAYGLDGAAVEMRVSRCLMHGIHYAADIG